MSLIRRGKMSMCLNNRLLVLCFSLFIVIPQLAAADPVFDRCEKLNKERLDKLETLNLNIETEKSEMLKAFESFKAPQGELLSSLLTFLKTKTELVENMQAYKLAFDEGNYSDDEIDELFKEDIEQEIENTFYEYGKNEMDQIVGIRAKKSLEWEKHGVSVLSDHIYDYTSEATKAGLIEASKKLPGSIYGKTDYAPYRFFIGFSAEKGQLGLFLKTFYRNRFARTSARSLFDLYVPILGHDTITTSVVFFEDDRQWKKQKKVLSLDSLPRVCGRFNWQ
jgi:hypothetical protein